MKLKCLSYLELFVEDLDRTISIVQNKFPAINIADIARHLPEQSIEWAAQSLEDGHGRWPEDVSRFKKAWDDYAGNGKVEFRNKMKVLYPNKNPKNVLQFSLHELERVDEALNQKSQRSIKQEIKEEGAELVYSKNGWKIIKILSGDAATFYSSGTKWCTSSSSTAEEYLESGPLYILIHNKVKIAQYHPGSSQLMDVQDHPYKVDAEIISVLKDAGIKLAFSPMSLSERIPEIEAEYLKVGDPSDLYLYAREVIKGRWPEAEPIIVGYSASFARLYAANILKRRWPEAEDIIAKTPMVALRYIKDFIGGRWPKAEPYIIKEPECASQYAKEIIQGRWPEAEPIMIKDLWAAQSYLNYLTKNHLDDAFEAAKNLAAHHANLH